MSFALALLIGVVAVVAWLLAAGVVALLAGRVIHERDAHDRPVDRAGGPRQPALVPR